LRGQRTINLLQLHCHCPTISEHSKGIQDDSDVDQFLNKCPVQRSKISGRRCSHSDCGKPDPGIYALKGDELGSTRYFDGWDDTIELIDQEDNVGGLSRSGSPFRAHRNPDIGGCQSGGIIDAITDHHDGTEFSLR
jgi:hypothetical protein